MAAKESSANHPDIPSQARTWWVRVDSGTMDASEKAEFQGWLNASPSHPEAFDQVNRLWQELDGIKEQLAALPLSAKKYRQPNRWQSKLSALAACFLAIVMFKPVSVWLRADEATGIAETRTIQLADGSTVQLNSETALAIHLTETTRQLTLLQGEAHFQVKSDPSRPFQVHAGNGVITALGTAFNVHHNTTSTDVTVTEHSVSVQLENDFGSHAQKIIVKNGQQVSFNKGTGLSAITLVDTQLATAWQRGKLVFQNKALGDVIAELNHYHHGYFMIADPTIANRRVNGVFSTDKPIAALNAVEQSLHLRSNRLSHYLVLLHR
jgi:transmembrane sensor